jgi:hypothetical protein
MDTPKRGTIDELCRRFVGTIRIGEDHFAGIPKFAKYIFALPTARQPLEVVLRLFPEDGSIKIVDFRNFPETSTTCS